MRLSRGEAGGHREQRGGKQDRVLLHDRSPFKVSENTKVVAGMARNCAEIAAALRDLRQYQRRVTAPPAHAADRQEVKCPLGAGSDSAAGLRPAGASGL